MAERDPRIEQLKQELKPMMKQVNQRLLRLERANLTSTHGYAAVQRSTGAERPRFNMGGKSVEELLQDKQRMMNFLDYKNSTVTGTKNELKRLAQQMRVPFANDPERIMEEASKFYRLSNYVKQYIRNSSQERHISSDEVFMGISRAVEAGDVDLNGINFDNFDLGMQQMEDIVRKAGGEQRSIDLEDQMNNVQYSRQRRVRPINRDDY